MRHTDRHTERETDRQTDTQIADTHRQVILITRKNYVEFSTPFSAVELEIPSTQNILFAQ